MNAMRTQIETPLGWLTIVGNGSAVIGLDILDAPTSSASNLEIPEYLTHAAKELSEYFRRERQVFSIPIAFEGTDFQKDVWNELLTIPYGRTTTYLAIALKLGDRKAIRAVGQAVGSNPIAIIIPCHRVLGTNGDLTGFAWGLPRKKKLLSIENPLEFAEQSTLFV